MQYMNLKFLHYPRILLLLVVYLNFLTAMFSQLTNKIEIQGHRGCRGHFPENTIAACVEGLRMGASTLEIDVVISKDNQVIVSHEPYFSHLISTHPTGLVITKDNEKSFNIYQMNVSEVQKFDVGQKVHPDFPTQQPSPAFKPTLQQLADGVREAEKHFNLPEVRWNIEIKRNPAFDEVTHPDPETFVRLVVEATKNAGLLEKCNFQSFDPQILRILKESFPQTTLAFLVHTHKLPDEHFTELGFVPHIYSPHYSLISQNVVKTCHQKGVKVIPWTVNEMDAIREMIEYDVDGIISDYPDRVIHVLGESNK